jgi:Fe-S-cluster containining protein
MLFFRGNLKLDIHLSKALNNIKSLLLEASNDINKRRIKDPRIPCKSGCAGCCSRYSAISVAESLILLESLKEKNKWKEVRGRAKKQAPIITKSNSAAWYMMNIKCPILDLQTNKCLAYKVRPISCATHFVTSNPKLCDPWEIKSGDFESLDYKDIYREFYGKMKSEIAGFGIMNFVLSIPVSLLLAERINVQSGLSLEKVISLFFNEL